MDKEKEIEIYKSILYDSNNSIILKRKSLEELSKLDTVENVKIYKNYYQSLIPKEYN